MKSDLIWKVRRPAVHFTKSQITTLVLSTIFIGALAAMTSVILIPVDREYGVGTEITRTTYIPEKPPPPK